MNETIASICMRLLCGYQDGSNFNYPEVAYNGVDDVDSLVRALYVYTGQPASDPDLIELRAYLRDVIAQMDKAMSQSARGEGVNIDTSVSAWGKVKPW